MASGERSQRPYAAGRGEAIPSRRGRRVTLLSACLCALVVVGEGSAPGPGAGWVEPGVDVSMARSLRRANSGGVTNGQANGGFVVRSKSTVWFEGYKAGCMQFLQNYIPDAQDGKPLVIGVAGGSGSGKTTIKDVMVEQLSSENCCVLPHDNYYRHRPELSDEERDNINFDHPDSLETELMVKHLQELVDGDDVDIPVYDFATHLRKKETVRIEARPVIIVEGILILNDPQLRKLMNLCVYVDVEADRRLIRRIDRDMVERGRSFASIVHQYLSTVKPMHDLYVEPSKSKADIIIPFGGRNVAAVQVLLDRLKTHLRNNFAFSQHQQQLERQASHSASGGSGSGSGWGDDQEWELPTPLYTGPSGSDVQLKMDDDLERFKKKGM